MTIGFIYCLENHCMPGICKIGMTDRSPSQRCAELSSSTSAPAPFEILFYAEVDNAGTVERAIHRAFDFDRVSDNREFFRCKPIDVYQWLLRNTEIHTEYLDGDIVFELQKRLLTVVCGGA